MTEETRPSPVPGTAPGRMTTVMRAATAPGHKVLRVAVVRGGRIVEERIIRARTDVTVGPGEQCTFSVWTEGGPRSSVRIFEARGAGYVLHLRPGMSARLSTSQGIVEVPGDGGPISLDADARGKITLAGSILLFQFVAAPPKQARSALPPSLVRGNAIDWVTTVIAAFSFLIHFGAVGSIYSDWLDTIVDDDIHVGALLDRMVPMPPPPDVELPSTDDLEKPDQSKPTTEPSPTPQPTKQRGGAHDGGKDSEAALSRALQQLQFETLGVIAQGGPATEGVLRHSEVPTNALDGAAARDVGVGPGDLVMNPSPGTPVRVGTGPGLAVLGTRGIGPGGDVGNARPLSGPPGTIALGKHVNIGARITNAAAVVASMRAGFKRCYDRALAQNADAEGRISLSIHVGPGGEVQSVSADTSGNLPPSVGACVAARARAAQFDPPEGGLAVVQVPVTFVKQ